MHHTVNLLNKLNIDTFIDKIKDNSIKTDTKNKI